MKHYTPEQIELFNKMFEIRREYDCFSDGILTKKGFTHVEGSIEMHYYTSEVTINLSDGTRFFLPFGSTYDPEEDAISMFNQFLLLEKDEKKFKEFLIEQDIFDLIS